MGSLVELVAFLVTMCVSVTKSQGQKDSIPPTPTSGFDNPRTTVVIYNDLGGHLPLRYHCKSKNDDLGDRTMAVNGTWSFEFRPSVFGGTLFFCGFIWDKELHWFDIYKQSRDREFAEFGCRRCEWKIRKDGPCKLNKNSNMFDVCLPWNSQSLLK
ncbi:putative plant self-incompatibility S1 [Arabidopsis thaliana]